MKKLRTVTAIVLMLFVLILAGCGGKDAAPAKSGGDSASPVTQPSSPQPNTPSPSSPAPAVPAPSSVVSLPGEMDQLKAALAQSAGVKYQIVTTAVTGVDKTAYLDQVLADRKWPEKDMLVLIIYTEENFDIRFAMGGLFAEHKVTVDEMLTAVRSQYLTRAREGDPAGGLADLVRTVNQRIGQ